MTPSVSTASIEPARPDGLPPQAQWSANQRCWIATEGTPPVVQRYYYPDGSPLSVQHLREGQPHGPFQRFHPNGGVAREGEFIDGQLHGEVIAYASDTPTQERLRACCVPPGSWSMRARFDQGRCLSEQFFDRQHRLLLDDGTLFPERPESVPESARFTSNGRRWEIGRYATGRVGLWRWWTEAGELLEEAEYQNGQRHGMWKRYASGQLCWDSEYRDGQPHGAHFQVVKPGIFADERIASIQGRHERGARSGLWRFRDGQGELIREVDYGTPCRDLPLDHPVLATGASGAYPLEFSAESAEALRQLVDDWTRTERHDLALLGSLRQAAATGRLDAARAQLESRTVALSAESSERRLKAIRTSKSDRTTKLADYVRALAEGAEAPRVLEEMAGLLLDAPAPGLELLELSVCLANTRGAEDHSSPLGTRALLLAELGHVEPARQEATALSEVASVAAEQLRAYLDVVFPRFDFWPERIELEREISDEVPNQVDQELPRVRRAIAKAARRLSLLRDAIRATSHADAEAWLPPDPSALSRDETVRLESYQFDVEEEGQEDTVTVAEAPVLDGVRLTDLMRQARLTWITLSWLCWSAGLDRIALPTRLAPPADFARALTTAFQRHWRAADRVQTYGLRARSLKLPSFVWEGLAIDEVPQQLANLAREDFLEMRAALFFMADGTCRSVWQDDLRG